MHPEYQDYKEEEERRKSGDGSSLVFVYGTLRLGESNSRFLYTSNFYGKAVTVDKFMMFGKGFPLCRKPIDNETLEEENCAPVIGEIYRVWPNTLASLDRLEGHPHFYTRTKVDVVPLKQTMYGMMKDDSVNMYIWADTRGTIHREINVPIYDVELKKSVHDWVLNKRRRT